MISFHKCSDLSSLLDLKAHYLQSLVAPMDGMWEVGIINPSPHWEIRMDGEQAGYYAANDEDDLLLFYVRPVFEKHSTWTTRYLLDDYRQCRRTKSHNTVGLH